MESAAENRDRQGVAETRRSFDACGRAGADPHREASTRRTRRDARIHRGGAKPARPRYQVLRVDFREEPKFFSKEGVVGLCHGKSNEWRWRLVEPSLHEHVKNLASVVDSAPKPELLARNDTAISSRCRREVGCGRRCASSRANSGPNFKTHRRTVLEPNGMPNDLRRETDDARTKLSGRNHIRRREARPR
jgi:hypothetical protein